MQSFTMNYMLQHEYFCKLGRIFQYLENYFLTVGETFYWETTGRRKLKLCEDMF